MQWRREQAHTCGCSVPEGIGLHGMYTASPRPLWDFCLRFASFPNAPPLCSEGLGLTHVDLNTREELERVGTNSSLLLMSFGEYIMASPSPKGSRPVQLISQLSLCSFLLLSVAGPLRLSESNHTVCACKVFMPSAASGRPS